MSQARAEVESAVLALLKEQGEINYAFAEMVQLLRSAATALEHNERDEAARLIRAAEDLEYDVLGECEISGRLAEQLGLEPGSNRPGLQTYYAARRVAGPLFRLVAELGQAEAGSPEGDQLVREYGQRRDHEVVVAEADLAAKLAVGRYVRVDDSGVIVEVP